MSNRTTLPVRAAKREYEVARKAERGVNGHRRYPAPGPSRRAVWVLIWLVVVLLVANVAHQAGVQPHAGVAYSDCQVVA